MALIAITQNRRMSDYMESVRRAGGEPIEGTGRQADVAAAPVALRAVSRHDADLLESLEVVGQKIGRHVELVLQFGGREVADGEEIDDPQAVGVAQRRVLAGTSLKGVR